MKKMYTKRLISLVLAVVLCLGLCIPAMAAVYEGYPGLTFSATLDKHTININNDEAQTVVLTVAPSQSVQTGSITYSISVPNGLELTSISSNKFTDIANYASVSNKTVNWFTMGSDYTDVNEIGILTFNVPAGTPAGEYEIAINEIELTHNGYTYPTVDGVSVKGSATTTLTITDPASGEQPDPSNTSFELYYTIENITADEDGDGYIDVEAGDTVTAGIYLKNTGNAEATLEGYDIVITNDGNLTYDTVEYDIGKGTKIVATSNAEQLNIQYIGKELSENIAADGFVKIASVPYTVGTDVASGVDMPITITFGALAIDNDALNVTPAITAAQKGVDTLPEYTVTFELEDGSKYDAYTVEYNGKATEPAAPTKTGHTFAGWYTDADVKWDFNTVVTGNMTLTAKWNVEMYTVTFNTKDGSTVDSLEVEYNNKVTKPVDPTKLGYTFGGWYKDEDLAAEWNFDNDVVTGDTTIYAKWELVTYKLTFKAGEETVLVVDFNVEMDAINAPAVPHKDGYNGVWDAYDLKTAEDQTVDAIYTAITYTIEFNLNGGTGETPNDISADYDEVIPLPNGDGFSRDGFAFLGWNTKQNATEAMQSTVNNLTSTDGATVILYAIWVDDVNEVTFNANGGEPGSTTVNVKKGEAVAKPADPTKTGYKLEGWYTDDGEKWDFTTVVPDDMTLTAEWTAEEYTLTFDAGNGSVTTTSITVKYDADYPALADPTPEPGYKFIGWFDEAGNQIKANDKVQITENTTVTAKYEIITYTVTFMNGETEVGSDTYTVEDTIITVPEVPTKVGYTGAWEDYDLNDLGDKTVNVEYTPIEYIITYVYNKDIDDGSATYTIENAVTLPTETKGNNEVTKWTVTTADGSWTLNDTFDAGAVIEAGKYGDVTLTAEWGSTIEYKLENYRYAHDTANEQLLIVNAAKLEEGKAYAVNGKQMYYLENATGYMEGADKGVYLYIVTFEDFDVDDLIIVDKSDEYELDKSTGDVNGNGKIDIGDANAVYQMLKTSGAEYTMEQIDIKGRLIADFSNNAASDSTERANIEDAKALVDHYNANKLNG